MVEQPQQVIGIPERPWVDGRLQPFTPPCLPADAGSPAPTSMEAAHASADPAAAIFG
jgi:hypothetical protein